MTASILSLPVSIEQVAALVKQMSRSDQQRLLELAPELQQLTNIPSTRTMAQMKKSVQQLQGEVLAALKHQPLSSDAPFLGDMTLEQYYALPEPEKASLWDEWAACDLVALDEQEVASNALSA